MKFSNRYYFELGKKAWNAEALRWLKEGCTWTESVTQANRLVGKNRQDLITIGKTQSKETEC